MAEEKINYVTWADNYSVRIPLIDEQHKELIKLTNELYDACLQGYDAAQQHFMDVIHKAVDYIKFHFSAEEKLMKSVNYPEFAAHKRQHESFVQKVMEDSQKFGSGKAVPYVFVNFLRQWVLTHIAVSDKAYSDYILRLKKAGSLNDIAELKGVE
jgi:hemerythrin